MSAALEYASERWWFGRGLEPYLPRVVTAEEFYAWTSVGSDAAPSLISGSDLARGWLPCRAGTKLRRSPH